MVAGRGALVSYASLQTRQSGDKNARLKAHHAVVAAAAAARGHAAHRRAAAATAARAVGWFAAVGLAAVGIASLSPRVAVGGSPLSI